MKSSEKESISKTKKDKLKLILKVIITFIIIGIVIAIIYFVGVFLFIKTSINIFANKIESYNEKQKNMQALYNSIPEELVKKEMIPANWKYVGSASEWTGEKSSGLNSYYFYIDEDKYDQYKHYWLEDVEKSKYNEDLNKNLWEYGEYVFYLVDISKLSYNSDTDYENVLLYKDKEYYLVNIYDKSIYFRYISNFRDENNYHTNSSYKFDKNNLLKEYIFYQNDNQWIIEEVYKKKG